MVKGKVLRLYEKNAVFESLGNIINITNSIISAIYNN